MELEQSLEDEKTSSAVVRKLEIIGETAKNIPDSVREKYPDIPWKGMSGMRDRLIHGYFGINYKLVWGTVRTDIPSLLSSVIQMLNAPDLPE